MLLKIEGQQQKIQRKTVHDWKLFLLPTRGSILLLFVAMLTIEFTLASNVGGPGHRAKKDVERKDSTVGNFREYKKKSDNHLMHKIAHLKENWNRDEDLLDKP